MKRFKFVHAADLHLDSPFAGIGPLPEAVRSRIRASTFRALERIVDLAVREQVDAVLFAGDVFDAADRSLRAQLKFRHALERLAEHAIPAFVAHGNHDPLDEVRIGLDWPDSVVVFGSGEVTEAPLDRPGRGTVATVHGISFGTAAVRDNLVKRFARGRLDVFQIGLLHANVDGQAEHDNYAPCRLSDLLAARLDYWALGHIHARRVLHEAPHVVYPGNPQGRSVKETGAKGCYLAEVSDAGRTRLEFRPTDDVRWFDPEVRLDGVRSASELRNRLEVCLEAALREADGRACVVRLTLAGRTPLHRELAESPLLDELLADWRERQAAAAEEAGAPFVWPASARLATGLPYDWERLRAQGHFAGELLRLADDWAHAPDLPARMKDVLAPLAESRAAVCLHGWDEREYASILREAAELAAAMLAEEMPDEHESGTAYEQGDKLSAGTADPTGKSPRTGAAAAEAAAGEAAADVGAGEIAAAAGVGETAAEVGETAARAPGKTGPEVGDAYGDSGDFGDSGESDTKGDDQG